MKDIIDKLGLDEFLAISELTAKYDKSTCPKCGLQVHPLERDQILDDRTVPGSRRRIINIPGNRHVIYDPICPKCRMALPAVILGGKNEQMH